MSVSTTRCPLCHWTDNQTQHLVSRLGTVLFLQDESQQGALVGSGVIIPTRHAETVFDLTPDEVRDSFALLNDVKAWMDQTYQPHGYNVGWNCGRIGGQDVMHAHLHVIPRFEDEPYAGRGIRYWLKQEANRRPELRR